jgi:hypothetical protein
MALRVRDLMHHVPANAAGLWSSRAIVAVTKNQTPAGG